MTQSEQRQQHLQASSRKSQEGWGVSIHPLVFPPSSPAGFIVPRDSCGGVGVTWHAKFIRISRHPMIAHSSWLLFYAVAMAESMRHLLWFIQRDTCLCSGHKVGRQSESSKCDSAGAFRHRQVKKEKSTWMNSQICEQRRVQKEYTRGINQHIFSLYYLYIQCNLSFFQKEIHRKIIKIGVHRAPQGTESFCVSQCTVLCTPFTH